MVTPHNYWNVCLPSLCSFLERQERIEFLQKSKTARMSGFLCIISIMIDQSQSNRFEAFFDNRHPHFSFGKSEGRNYRHAYVRG